MQPCNSNCVNDTNKGSQMRAFLFSMSLMFAAPFTIASERLILNESTSSLLKKITELLESGIEQDRVDVYKGTEKSQNVIKSKEIIFHPNGTLKLSTGYEPFIVVKTDTQVIQDSQPNSNVSVRQPTLTHGVDGPVGDPGAPGTYPGAAGQTGESGGDASSGGITTMPTFVLWVTGEVKFLNSKPGTPPLALFDDGIAGGLTLALGGGVSGGDDIYLVEPRSVLTKFQMAVIHNEGGDPGLDGDAGLPGSSGKVSSSGHRAANCRSAKSGFDPGAGASQGPGGDGASKGEWGDITLWEIP
jgi:hypothetical protein